MSCQQQPVVKKSSGVQSVQKKKQLPEAEQKRFSIPCEVRVVSGAVKQRLP